MGIIKLIDNIKRRNNMFAILGIIFLTLILIYVFIFGYAMFITGTNFSDNSVSSTLGLAIMIGAISLEYYILKMSPFTLTIGS